MLPAAIPAQISSVLYSLKHFVCVVQLILVAVATTVDTSIPVDPQNNRQ
jgi:hypothetical protein